MHSREFEVLSPPQLVVTYANRADLSDSVQRNTIKAMHSLLLSACLCQIFKQLCNCQMPCVALLQIGVLHWFARLWEIEQDKYWGYITNCGTEGNLHGILVGRENLPDGVLYASSETHYSVFKAARMYRMEYEKVSVLSARLLGALLSNDRARITACLVCRLCCLS